MRLIICNPHTFLGRTLFTTIFRTRHYDKYDYLFELLENPYNALIFVDGTASSLTGGTNKFPIISNNFFVMNIISRIEIVFWMIINKKNPLKYKLLFNRNKLSKKDDIIFGFAFLSDTFKNQKLIKKSIFYLFKGRKLMHASHYFSQTYLISTILKKLNIRMLVAEANIAENPYFKLYFDYIKKVITLPFAIREKYISFTPFYLRKPRCFITGNIFRIDKDSEYYKSLYNFYKCKSLHPIRDVLFENQASNQNLIVSKIYSEIKIQKTNTYNRFLKMLIRIVKPIHSAYYQFDIIKEYNKYQMFVAPEEIVGLPSINAIEGMACGCAFIGLCHPMYQVLGFKNNMNYIEYNGSERDLKIKIKYYQKHQVLLKKIAQNGKEFVIENFKTKKILDNFYLDLLKIKAEYN